MSILCDIIWSDRKHKRNKRNNNSKKYFITYYCAIKLIHYGGKNMDKSFDVKRSNDKAYILKEVKKNWISLKYASDELRNDKEVVLAAVKNWGNALKYASDELRNDKEVVLAAVKNWGDALKYASDELKNDKEVVLEAVKTGSALYHASEALRNDKDIVLEAICCDAYNFLYASEALRNNQDIIIQFLKHFRGDLADEQFAFITLKKFQNNKTLMHLAKENNPEFLSTLNYAIKQHEEGVINDIKEWGAGVLEDNYEYLTEPNRNEMFSNKEFVMKALKVDINVYKYVSEELKNDIDVISETLRNEYYDEDLDKKLLTNEAILLEIIRKDFNIITYLDDNIVEAHREGIYQNFIKSKNQFFDINSKTILFDMDEGKIHFKTLYPQKVFEQYATFKFSEYDKKVSITNLHIDIEPYKDRYISSFNVVNKEGITIAKMIANYPFSLDSFSSSKLEIVECKILNDELYLLIKLTSNRFTFFGRAATSLFTKRENENFDTFEYYDDDDIIYEDDEDEPMEYLYFDEEIEEEK